MSHPLWIVVANGSCARAFERSGAQEKLVELQNWVHPQTRMHASELSLDHPGPGHSGRGGLTPRIEQRHKARNQFAHELSQWLQAKVAHQNQGKLAVFSSNPFLGELMAELPATVHKCVCASHPTDLTALPFQALEERLRKDYRL
jgi:protein required for attachment to host cells